MVHGFMNVAIFTDVNVTLPTVCDDNALRLDPLANQRDQCVFSSVFDSCDETFAGGLNNGTLIINSH